MPCYYVEFDPEDNGELHYHLHNKRNVYTAIVGALSLLKDEKPDYEFQTIYINKAMCEDE